MKEAILGLRQFTDGVVRTVILDVEGRQYVCDDNDRRIYGTWLDPEKAEPDDCRLVTNSEVPTFTAEANDRDGSNDNQAVPFHPDYSDFMWIESEKAGRDIGLEYAIQRWVKEHWTGYLRSKMLEHLLGRKFWSELDKGDFGMLRNELQDDRLIVDCVIDRLKVNHENLDILMWAQDWGISAERVVRILEALDVNSRRISPRFDM